MNQLSNRPLGATEKLFWLLDQASQVHFVMAVEISAQVNKMLLQKALYDILISHPLLSCRIVPNGYEHPYFEHVPQAIVPLRIVNQWLPDTLTVEIANELSMPFDGNAAPLIRCALINNTLNSVILLSAHHAACDGISMTFIIRDLMRALSGEKIAISPIPSSIDQLLGLAPQSVRRGIKSSLPDQVLIVRQNHKQPNVYIEKMDAAHANPILTKCKSEGITFQGALYAAALTAARSAALPWSNGKIKVVIPVSVRKQLTEGQSSALYINSKALVSEVNEDFIDFWAMARRAKRELSDVHEAYRIKNNAIEARDRLFSGMHVVQLSDALQKGVTREMMISNIGRIPFNTNFGNLKLKFIWGPVALSGAANEITIGVTTVDNRICLTMASRMDAPYLLKAVTAELFKACGL